MEIKVRELDVVEQKSIQEVEQNLLDKHDSELINDEPTDTDDDNAIDSNTVDDNVVEDKKLNLDQSNDGYEIKEEDVLSFIKNRYGKEINSIEELTREREEAEELPGDVSAYFKYKKETGRGIEDFVKLNRDLDEVSPDKLLKEYLTITEKGLDEEDIESMMDEYIYDEEFDDDSAIKKARLAKKKMVAKAKDYFESEKEKYKVPIESMGSSVSDDDKEKIEEYNRYVKDSMSLGEEIQRKQQLFKEKTREVFGSEFKGFEFTLDDNKLVFAPGDADEMNKINSDPTNFTKKFLGEDGLLVDPVGYHKALSVAMNPQKFAEFFYKQGKSAAVDDVMRKTKNVNMSEQNVPQNIIKGGTTIREIGQDSGRGLRIKSKNKN